MRLAAFVILALIHPSACKTTRKSPPAGASLDSFENEKQLPACDDITVGRVYWVRSLSKQLICEDSGTWEPLMLEADSSEKPGAGPRTIP
jgi:hypothetical protein